MKFPFIKIIFISFLFLVFGSLVHADWSAWEEPVVYYDFEAAPGSVNVKDRIGNNNLTLTASSGSATGIQIGGKYGTWQAKFNGSTDYAEADDSSTFSQTGSFSVEAWVKFDTISSTENAEQTVLAKWDETTGSVAQSYKLVIITDSTGRAFPNFVIDSSGNGGSVYTLKGKTQMVADEWYLFQGVYDDTTNSGTAYLYVNGVREAIDTTIGSSIADTTAKFYVGAAESSAGSMENFLDGSVDELRVFDDDAPAGQDYRSEGSIAYSMERGKPVVKMDFDDGSGLQAMNRAPDFSRGALVNFPADNSQWVQGNNNYALQFDGTDDFVDLGSKNNLQLGGAITISVWISPTDLAANYAIVGQPDSTGYAFKITTGGEMTFGETDGTPIATSDGASITASTWQNIAVSYDGTNASFYKDGRLITSTAVTFASPPSAGSVFAGRASSEYFKGKMDDLLIYSYNRTLFEVYVDLLGGAVKFGKLQSLEPANAQIACPDGFVHVPGDPLFGTSDFCVMKYEAKCDVDGDGVGETAAGAHAACNTTYDTWGNILTGCKCETDKGGNIVSSAAGHSMARIAQDDGTADDAKSYCESQGWHLITNNEWMTIARNVERLGSNWCALNGGSCGNSPGTNYLVAGHNDNSPALALQASTTDSQACYGTVTKDVNTACGSAGTQKRNHNLSNGEVVWDMAGGVWEWTDDTIMGADKPVGNPSAWVEWTAVSDYGTLSYDITRPSNSAWYSDKRVGQYYQGSASAGPYAFLRGAYWSNTSNAGVFTLNLNNTPGYSSNIHDRVSLCVCPVSNFCRYLISNNLAA